MIISVDCTVTMVQAHIEQLNFRYPEVSHYAPYDDGVVIKMTTRLCEI